jgi:hypothetical protein
MFIKRPLRGFRDSRVSCVQVFFRIFTRPLESLRVVFPAVCGELVIPAEAGIQKTGLDSASSAE